MLKEDDFAVAASSAAMRNANENQAPAIRGPRDMFFHGLENNMIFKKKKKKSQAKITNVAIALNDHGDVCREGLCKGASQADDQEEQQPHGGKRASADL